MASPAVLTRLSEAKDKRKELLKSLGDLTHYRVTKNYNLVALYIGGKTFAGTSILRSDSNLREDVWQGQVGLLVKCGPTSFKQSDMSDEPERPFVGDWVVFNPGDGHRIQINGIDCRWLHEDNIRGSVPDPEMITHRT